MENEMVGCAIDFCSFLFLFFWLNILSCQEEKVMILVLSVSLFLSPSLPFRNCWFGSSNQEKLLYCYHRKHFIFVLEAPTVLCGQRPSKI